ncbi:discoidin domain-containing protein [Curtobacterium flaccumfaciens]|uniref:discoidin domain-containing protein n=1 Tax=Curtobacterium flaccumfaciens TaxID=2035 RepID=UPI001E41B66B|nr:discoidin domain-containing protein [Curtobacterium allii]MCE0459466.1 discoidin domain-containing protein [Curtobacterium allii]
MTDTVAISATTSAQGFSHPGVGVSAASLERTREQLIAGAEPWASYYKAMVVTPYASTTLGSANQGPADGVPADPAFDDVSVSDRLGQDSEGAYTQAILYYLTGDATYRENALKIVRIWSHMDPSKYKFFADAQIKTGPFVYRMVAAAELLRYTSSASSSDGYLLAWTDQDTADFTTNFAVPVVNTMNYGNAWYMNQGTLPLLGAMASYIFTDNRARYTEGVEWFTVNSTHPNQDVNGALASMYRLIDKTDPRNPYGKSFVNHLEMGRDQAHAGDDVLTLTTLARIVSTQGTLLDPKEGTVSTAKNAVDPYTFMGNRLLTGSNAFFGFMEGHDVPWIDITQQGGKLAQSYRGRWSNSLNELYQIYTYDERVNVARVAPYIAQQFEQRDGPLFYNFDTNEVGSPVGSDGLRSFWGGTLTGDDYWLSLPAGAEGQQVPAPVKTLPFTQKGTVINGTATAVTENRTSFLRAKSSAKGTTIAVRTMQYGARDTYSPVALRVRTTAPATLQVRSTATGQPYQTVNVPNTKNQWRYITYDMATSVVPVAAMGDNNIVYYTVRGTSSQIDLDSVTPQASTTLSRLTYSDTTTSLVGVQGAPLQGAFAAQHGADQTVTYSAVNLPRGATFNTTTGKLTWTPSKRQTGDFTVHVQADDGTTTAAIDITMHVAKDRAAAIAFAQNGFDHTTTYTTASKAPFDAAVSAAKSLVNSGSDADFAAALSRVSAAVSNLQLLTPLLDDGTLDYAGIAASSTLSRDALRNLTDGDSYTFTGDLSVNSFAIDFGADYRVTASAFDLQARQTFGNRSEGANVYGSLDGSSWTKLTTKETTNTNTLETLPVDPALAHTAYRFFKVQVDNPGTPSDPNFPGIFSLAEFHIHGGRTEAVNRVTAATISSNNAVPGIATVGDVVTVKFTTSEPVTAINGTIAGTTATIGGGGTSWTASATMRADNPSGSNASFSIGYTTANGTKADPLTATSDGSKVFLSNDTDLIGDVPSISIPVSASGELETSKRQQVANMFDGNAGTFSDIGPVNGQYYATLDFGSGGSVAVQRAELLVRQDTWGTSRAPRLHLEGSNDQTTWTAITNNAQSTLDWQTLSLRPGTAPAAYRYLKISNDNWINIAELRLFGTRVAPPVTSVTAAQVASSGADAGRAVQGDTVTVDFTTSEAITEVKGTIDGRSATITGSGTVWHAATRISSEDVPGHRLTFTIDYSGPNGEPRQALTNTTDGSTVYVTSNDGLIQGIRTRSTPISPTGQPEPAKQVYVDRLFDSNPTTFSDVGPVNGQAWIILDLGAEHAVTLQRAELQVRQDAFGTGRSGNLHLEGSNDLTAWTPLTGNAAPTLAWQELTSKQPTTGYRFIKIANTDWINIAELRLFGSYR